MSCLHRYLGLTPHCYSNLVNSVTVETDFGESQVYSETEFGFVKALSYSGLACSETDFGSETGFGSETDFGSEKGLAYFVREC